MKVQVVDLLPAITTTVNHGAVTTTRQPFPTGWRVVVTAP